MSKSEWTKVGSVEVCVGTNGKTTGMWTGDHVAVSFGTGKYDTLYSKDEFEAKHCKPPEPKHRLIESADGSVCVVSTEEQDGKPVRMAFVRTDSQGEWDVHWMWGWDVAHDRQDAIDRAARYVETGD